MEILLIMCGVVLSVVYGVLLWTVYTTCTRLLEHHDNMSDTFISWREELSDRIELSTGNKSFEVEEGHSYVLVIDSTIADSELLRISQYFSDIGANLMVVHTGT